MKTNNASIFLTLLLFFSIFIPNELTAQIETTKTDSAQKTRISEEKFILINGIEQWITIKGESSKPIILFLHGGPGSPLSPYADKLYKDLEADFIVVQWDQRGTGKTYGKTAPEELTPEYLNENPLTLDLMITDGIELSEYLLKHLGKEKIILFGTSWGSVLGVKLASKRPDLFYAYVGHSQVTHPIIDAEFYKEIYTMAEAKSDKVALEILNAIGKPPYDRARNAGQLLRVAKKYEMENSIPAPENWFVPAPEYDNEKDHQNRMDGDDYSFVNYVGDSKFGVAAMSSTINIIKEDVAFKIPIYLIQGSEDILTPMEKTKSYFQKIKAPKKKYYLLPKTAHEFNTAVLETQYKIFKSIKTSRNKN